MDTDTKAPAGKARDTGVVRMKFEMTDGHIHLWMGPTAAWEAGPGAEDDPDDPAWSVQHVDLDTGRVAAVRYVLRDRGREPRIGCENQPYPSLVTMMRKIRSLVLDALESSDDVTGVVVTAGGDGRAEFRVNVDDGITRQGRFAPGPAFVRLVFHDDQSGAW